MQQNTEANLGVPKINVLLPVPSLLFGCDTGSMCSWRPLGSAKLVHDCRRSADPA